MDFKLSIGTALIIIGIVVGALGIAFLVSSVRRKRTAGVLLFPFMPSVILFAITFPNVSDANIDYLGKLSGPIAAYVAVALLARRFIKQDIENEDKVEAITQLKASEAQLKESEMKLSNELQEITKRYSELRNQIETARPKPLSSGKDREYFLPQDHNRRIIILTGSIRGIKNVDVVVNSENEEMQLARIYDPSISGMLRYLDAEIGGDGYIVHDWMDESLQKEIKSKEARLPVKIGIVFVTKTANLAARGVKYIFHVAAVKGEIGAGYKPVVEQLDVCIQNCYRQFHSLADKDNIETILFPLIGAGTAKLSPLEAAEILLPQVVQGMLETPKVKVTYLLAWVDSHRQALHKVAEKIKLIVPNAAS